MRGDIWSHSAEVIGDFGVAGSGIGTFPSVYPLVEDPKPSGAFTSTMRITIIWRQ